MALFRKEERSPYERLIEEYDRLPDEDKKAFHDKIMSINKAEDEREIDKVEEDRAEDSDKRDEKKEEVKAESEQIGKDINDAEDEVKEKSRSDVEDAQRKRLDALMDEFSEYKSKVDKLYSHIEELDKPAGKVGLGRQKAVELADDDEELSAREYALKNAKY